MCFTASQVQEREQAPPAHIPGGHPLAQLVRDNTNQGEMIVRFLIDAMKGRIDGAKPSHRIDAARLLLKLGCDDARAFIADFSRHTRPGGGSAYSSGAIVGRHNRKYVTRLAKFARSQTGNGRDLVNFLVDAMLGRPEDFKPAARLAAAKELLRLGWETVPTFGKNRKTRRSEAVANGPKANGPQAAANGPKANGRKAAANGAKAPVQRPKQQRPQKNLPEDRTDSSKIRQPQRTAATAAAHHNGGAAATTDTARPPADPPGAPRQDGSSQEPRPGPGVPSTEPGNRRRGSSPPPVSRPPPLVWV